MNDQLERLIETILSVGTLIASIWGTFCGHFNGNQGMILIIASFAIYQSTSITKIIKKL